MRTNLKFWLVMLLFFNAIAYAIWWSDLFQYSDTPRYPQLLIVTQLPLQTVLLSVANAFVCILSVFFYVFEKFRDKEEDRRATLNKREARRRYYRRRSERRKQGKPVPA